MRAILNYEDLGSNKVCGQTIGANGAGVFCIIYTGDEEKIHVAVSEFLRNLEKSGRLGKYILVYDEETLFRNAVTEIIL